MQLADVRAFSAAIATSSFAIGWPARKLGRDSSSIRDEDENFFLLMAEPPQAVTRDEIPPRDYVFVMDVSGSMFGFPLDTAKKLLGDLVNVLRPTDTFNIVVFASGFEVFSPVSVPATHCQPPTRALQFIGEQERRWWHAAVDWAAARGALPREPGLARSIVLLTDGYIDAEADVFDYVREHLDDANFFAFGIGSSVNRYLIEGVARAGLGEPFIVTKPDEAPEAAEQLRRYIETPVLTDIDVRFAGFDVYDVEPGKIPDLFASRPIVVFGKWRGAHWRLDRDLGQDRTRRVSDVDPGGAARSRCEPCRASPSLGADAHRRISPISARPRRARIASAEITSLGTDVQPADEVHVVHRGARGRATHQRRRRRCGSAAAAAGGRVRSRRRSDEWSRARTDVGLGGRHRAAWSHRICCACGGEQSVA